MSKREIERQYNKLMLDVKSNPYYTSVDLTNKVQAYCCQEGHITVMRVLDAGVTPMFYRCEHCNKMASSVTTNLSKGEPSQEWYRPSLKELLKVKPAMVDHVLSGGLMIRKIK